MSDQVDKITLVCTTLGKNPDLLQRMLKSAVSRFETFDQIIIHTDAKEILVITTDGTRYHIPALIHFTIPEAYNFIIEKMVKTQWVCCMCDDDYFYPEGLEKMIAEVHKGIDADVAHFKFHVSGYIPPEDKRCWFGKKEYDLWERGNVVKELLKGHNRIPAASFFRKQTFEMVGGFKGDKCHDQDLWTRMAKAGIEFKYFEHKVYNYVRRDNSAWVQQNSKKN